MARIVIYDAAPIDKEQISEGLKQTDHSWYYVDEPISLSNVDPEAEVVSVFVSSSLTAKLMKRMPKLKLVAARSTGFDNIDLSYAQEHDIVVENVPTYGENTVAEYAFSLLLAVTRKLVPTITETERGTFNSSQHIGMDLQGRTFGIVGLGHIGRHAAMIARGFGMHVIAYDVYHDEEFAYQNQVEYVSFNDVLARSDVLSLHAPMTPSNYHLINDHTIAQMKPGAILINTARGELVENRALIIALQTGRLYGAGLDTVEGEKFLDRNHLIEAIAEESTPTTSYEHATENYALLHMPNVVVTEHSAFNTAQAIQRINTTTVQNMIDFWYGKTPNVVRARGASVGKLVIVRHTASDWNEQGRWTGSRDVHLSVNGREQAGSIGEALRGIDIDYAYSSEQMRSIETLDEIIKKSGHNDLPREATAALNERDYGVYTGMHKQTVEEAIGEEAYNKLRRSWDGPVEGGESLKDVYQRTVPFYLRIILPRLRHGQNILIVAHGNSIRSLRKYIENISDDEIGSVEMLQDKALVYSLDTDGRSKSRDEVDTISQT